MINESTVFAIMVGLGILSAYTIGVALGNLFDYLMRRLLNAAQKVS